MEPKSEYKEVPCVCKTVYRVLKASAEAIDSRSMNAGLRLAVLGKGAVMGKYVEGDYVKAEFQDDASGESEWMWVIVHSSDDERRIVFGRLDNEPIVFKKLRLGQEIAVSYDLIREHRSATNS